MNPATHYDSLQHYPLHFPSSVCEHNIYIYVNLHIYICIHIYVCTHKYVCRLQRKYGCWERLTRVISTFRCTHTYIYLQIHIDTCMYLRTHICMQITAQVRLLEEELMCAQDKIGCANAAAALRSNTHTYTHARTHATADALAHSVGVALLQEQQRQRQQTEEGGGGEEKEVEVDVEEEEEDEGEDIKKGRRCSAWVAEGPACSMMTSRGCYQHHPDRASHFATLRPRKQEPTEEEDIVLQHHFSLSMKEVEIVDMDAVVGDAGEIQWVGDEEGAMDEVAVEISDVGVRQWPLHDDAVEGHAIFKKHRAVAGKEERLVDVGEEEEEEAQRSGGQRREIEEVVAGMSEEDGDEIVEEETKHTLDDEDVTCSCEQVTSSFGSTDDAGLVNEGAAEFEYDAEKNEIESGGKEAEGTDEHSRPLSVTLSLSLSLSCVDSRASLSNTLRLKEEEGLGETVEGDMIDAPDRWQEEGEWDEKRTPRSLLVSSPSVFEQLQMIDPSRLTSPAYSPVNSPLCNTQRHTATHCSTATNRSTPQHTGTSPVNSPVSLLDANVATASRASTDA